MSKLTLISHHLCPYVQRAVIALTEKGIEFERKYIDLSNKPDWFLELSPTGKVPVLVTEEGVIFESNVILEYIEDTTDTPLHPADPFERARHRAWMEFGSGILSAIASFYSAPDKATYDAKLADLRDRFSRVEQELVGGSYFTGETFSLVDTVFGPIFRYLDEFERVENLDIVESLPKIAKWRAALSQRASVKGAVSAEYPQALRKFLKNKDSYLSDKIAA